MRVSANWWCTRCATPVLRLTASEDGAALTAALKMQAAADSAGYHAARRGRHHHSASSARSAGYGEDSGHSADCENTEYDKVVGLDTGADDYIPKPFGMMELIRAHSCGPAPHRGYCRTKDEPRPLVASGICVDERAHTVFVNEQEVQLTLKELPAAVPADEKPRCRAHARCAAREYLGL